MSPRIAVLVALGAAALALAGPAFSSQVVGTNATDVSLAADNSGRALVTFRSGVPSVACSPRAR